MPNRYHNGAVLVLFYLSAGRPASSGFCGAIVKTHGGATLSSSHIPPPTSTSSVFCLLPSFHQSTHPSFHPFTIPSFHHSPLPTPIYTSASSIICSITSGLSKVEVSPIFSVSLVAILRKMRRMIFPLRVLGSPLTN